MALTLTNNSPSAGYIAWTACNMQYNGVSYAIPAGNTNNIYVYWQKASPNAFQTSSTFPTLGADDCIVFLNKNGVGLNVLTATALDGDLIVPGSIYASAIAANTITSDQIAASSILGGDIAASTITSGLIAANAIGTAALAANAVTSTQIAANTITASDIAASTITTNEIAANTIVGGDIAASTITGTNIAASTITASNIAANTITAGLIAANAIGAAAIAAGAITTDKLDVRARSLINNFTTSAGQVGWNGGGSAGTIVNDPSVTGMQPPMVKPTLSTATTGGTVPAATYYVVYTYKNSLGETTKSPEASITTTGTTSTITVGIPVKPPGVTSVNVYISTSSGTEKLQGNTTSTSYTQTAAISTTSAALPTTNTALGSSASRGNVLKITTSGNVQEYTDAFLIDPTQTYKVTMSVTNQPVGYSQSLGNNTLYFGLYFYDANLTEIAGTPFTVATRSWGTPATNPYFWYTSTGASINGWRDMEAYLIATTVTNPAEVPDGKNVSTHWKIPPNAKYAAIRVLNYYNNTSVDAFFYSPSVIAVNAGQINASQITAGTLNAINITGGTIDGAHITSKYDFQGTYYMTHDVVDIQNAKITITETYDGNTYSWKSILTPQSLYTAHNDSRTPGGQDFEQAKLVGGELTLTQLDLSDGSLQSEIKLWASSAGAGIGLTTGGSGDQFINVNVPMEMPGIYSPYNDFYMMEDHNNGNVSVSAAGSNLFLGYWNTSLIYLHAATVAEGSLDAMQFRVNPSGSFWAVPGALWYGNGYGGTGMYLYTTGWSHIVTN